MVLLVDFPGISFFNILNLAGGAIPLFKILDNTIWGGGGARFYKILGNF